uniref:Arrowhead n=1 Tax=Timema cristinae TaxID=61476 RepID=A0A7R9GWD1_TIMCR|nr:unnamed protein product [Timema cristinae]
MYRSFGAKCSKCSRGISASDWVRKARDHVYHLACFACDACKRQLSTGEEFALHEDRVLCKTHYLDVVDGGRSSADGESTPSQIKFNNLFISALKVQIIFDGFLLSFGAKCSKCSRGISASDWVRKARDHVYHLACFACDACKRQLSTGEEFALHEDRVLCKTHYLDVVDGGRSSADEGCDSESYHKNKAKRVRTTFTEEQLQVLQANFQLDSNPDGQDLERIAQITGLSKRVTQVWFQNSRARQKKHSTIVAQQTDSNIHSHPHHRLLAHQLHHSVFPMSEVHLPPESLSQSPDLECSSLTMLYSVG